MDEKPAVDLSAVPLSALTAEIKRRMTEFTEAQHMMSGFVPSTERAPVTSVTKRARFSGNTMKAAALDRWSKWASYKKDHPNASTKDYFKWRKSQK